MYNWLLERTFILTWASLVLLFYVAMLAGSIAYHFSPASFREQIASFIMEYYETRVPRPAFNPLALFILILVNNSMVVIISLLLSITVVFPILVMIVNGVIVGFVVSLTAFEILVGGSPSYLTLYMSLAPHGIIEIPAIALASSAFSVAFTRGFRAFISSLPGILLLSLSMILIAALIESTITLILAALTTYITGT